MSVCLSPSYFHSYPPLPPPALLVGLIESFLIGRVSVFNASFSLMLHSRLDFASRIHSVSVDNCHCFREQSGEHKKMARDISVWQRSGAGWALPVSVLSLVFWVDVFMVLFQ